MRNQLLQIPMKAFETFICQWCRLSNTMLPSPRLSGASNGFENELDTNAWCLISPCIEVSKTDVTVGLRIPEPHTQHAHTQVLGQTLALEVLKSSQNPDTADPIDSFRRAIHLPVPVLGHCAHHFAGPFLVVVIPRELQNSGVTRAEAEKSSKGSRSSTRKQSRAHPITSSGAWHS